MGRNRNAVVVQTTTLFCAGLLIIGCSKSSLDAPQSDRVTAPSVVSRVTQEQQPIVTETVQPSVSQPAVKTAEPARNRASNPREWVELLAGSTLDQWSRVPADSTDEDWMLSDGILACRSNKHGWLVSHEQYADFELSCDFRLAAGSNSGLYFHYSGQGRPSASSFAVQLIEDSTYPGELKPTQRAGAIWGRVAPTKSALNPVGEWNHIRVYVEGNLVQVTLNDERVVDVRLSELHQRPTGYLVIGNWRGEGKGSEFREMQIRTL